jgi:hypothetical protein
MLGMLDSAGSDRNPAFRFRGVLIINWSVCSGICGYGGERADNRIERVSRTFHFVTEAWANNDPFNETINYLGPNVLAFLITLAWDFPLLELSSRERFNKQSWAIAVPGPNWAAAGRLCEKLEASGGEGSTASGLVP